MPSRGSDGDKTAAYKLELDSREVVNIILHLFMSAIKYMRNNKNKKTRKKNNFTYFPSSSLRSYSSVKRVDVATIAFDIGVLFITAAILLIDVVVGGDTFISFLLLLVVLLLVLILI